jgi:hypothetical protein
LSITVRMYIYDDLELDAIATTSQAPKQNAFEVMMGKSYDEKRCSYLIKQAFNIRAELSDRQKK